MRLLIALVLVTFACADLPATGYRVPTPSRPFSHGGGGAGRFGTSGGHFGGSSGFGVSGGHFGGSSGFGVSGGHFGGSGGGGFVGGGGSFGACSGGLVRHVDGSCVQPIITRNIFHYTAPQQQFLQGAAPVIPQPKIDYNIVFVRTPESVAGQGPIVVPPAQQKTLVYVLSRNGVLGGQRVIEVPSTPQSPEVYYINYNEGENPSLPGGIDLQSALSSASQQQGKVIGGGGGAGFGGGSGLSGGAAYGGSSFAGSSFGGGSHGGSSFSGGSVGGGVSKKY